MQKVFSLEPTTPESVKDLQTLLSDGYKVVHVTANHVAIAGRGDSISTDCIEGRIVYILEK